LSDSTNIKEIVKRLEKRVAEESINETDMITLGHYYYLQGRLKEAIDTFQNILQIHPHFALVYYHLGLAYFRAADLKKARESMFNQLSGW